MLGWTQNTLKRKINNIIVHDPLASIKHYKKKPTLFDMSVKPRVEEGEVYGHVLKK